MLLSTRHRFVFIATLKTASTAIEAALAPHASIHIAHTRFGKHMTLSEVMDRFAYIFEEEPFEKFESFAVVREPAERLHSLYRSHKDSWFERNKPDRWTGKMSFTEFLTDWLRRYPKQAVSQTEQLTDSSGHARLKRLISFERMPEIFPEFAEKLVPDAEFAALPKRNESRSQDEISEADRQSVYDLYADDVALYRHVRRQEQAYPRSCRNAAELRGQPAPRPVKGRKSCSHQGDEQHRPGVKG
ncbi:sulfotransferase family 2 domain-containing protein [Parvularcula maris]|uniref:Sulfotransferase family 2 domain-containing protein n=1 Tax=Parvularcula maris TaxID=2965077 RepID=A0A9X2RHY2_9PROT|nr:sulfotransferase family 2 domain-containing protein [Parvularcula maris]MCQ8185445.1 sulfotransferase family 2 domain-containing protein [Parvularcula maris]